MGKPVKFDESNFVWKGWPADAATGREAVLDLHSFRDGKGETVSCWKMSWWERVQILFTGKVWLGVAGHHPPVWVSGLFPFIKTLEHGERESGHSAKV